MATILGASVINEQESGGDEGESRITHYKPLWDYMISAYDDFVDLVASADNDISGHVGDQNRFADGSTNGEYHDFEGNTTETFYRGLSQRSRRAAMYWMMSQLVFKYTPVRGKADRSIAQFPETGDSDAARLWFRSSFRD